MGGCSSKEAGAGSSQKVIQNLLLSQSYTCFFMLTQNPFSEIKGAGTRTSSSSRFSED
jgi:hypothetical protein